MKVTYLTDTWTEVVGLLELKATAARARYRSAVDRYEKNAKGSGLTKESLGSMAGVASGLEQAAALIASVTFTEVPADLPLDETSGKEAEG